MDSHELFKRLTAGATFDRKRFFNDALKFKMAKPNNSQPAPLSQPDNLEMLDGDNDSASEGSGDENEDEFDPRAEIIAARKARKEAKRQEKTPKDLAKAKREEVNKKRKAHQIFVQGPDVPPPVETFEELAEKYQVSETLVANIKSKGYETPTPIQMQAIPLMMNRREMLACAPTGSGKTAAFLVPLIHCLAGPQRKGFRAVIVSPTRELASQTYRECVKLTEGIGLRCHVIDNVTKAAQKFGPKSSQKFDILVTTPNRLVFLISQEPAAISLKNVEWLVVDESDKLFEEGRTGFRDQLGAIYRACDSPLVRRAFFSATCAYDVEKWCKTTLSHLVTLTVGRKNAAAEIVEQKLVFVGSESGKLMAFRNLIVEGLAPPVLVFVQTKERAKELYTELVYEGINVDVIHAERTQLQRDNVVKSFRSGQIWVLICTELMGRGIDFKGVNLVVNYDFPPSAISYVHRIGRTGRAGKPGKAITFFTENDSVYLRNIAQVMRNAGCEVPEYMLQMKKPSKNTKKKLAKEIPHRERISTEPFRVANKRKHREEGLKALKASKMTCRKQTGKAANKKPKVSSAES